MSIFKKLLFIVFSLFFCAVSLAQTARSPFSRQGLGDVYGNALINNQGMGGVGVSQPQYWFLNNQNPALLVYNNLTVFQFGITAESKTIRQDTLSEKSVGGNLNYIATAFPVKPGRWTTAIGLLPYTTTKYQTTYTDYVQFTNETDSLEVTEKGEGGLSQLYWSNGVRIYKGLSIGLKATYIFGSIKNTYSNRLINTNQPVNYISTIEEKLSVKDFMATGGIAYSIDSLFKSKRYRLTFGATYAMKADLNTTLRREKYRETLAGPVDTDRDTISITSGSTSLPSAFTAGVSLAYGMKWNIGAEFSYQDWSTFSTINQNADAFGKSWRFALGGETTPDPFSNNYFRRLTYRAGFSYEQTPYLVNVSTSTLDPAIYRKVNDVGINVGFSLPAGRSSLDFAVRYGKRGNKSDTILDEQYVRVFFGITFNDQWFIKRKFD